jgi:hypothetical protein
MTQLPKPPPMVDAAVLARCVRRVEAARMQQHKKTLALWALQHPNQTSLAVRGAYLHVRAGNPQLWSATALGEQAPWGTKGSGFATMCGHALHAAVACGAMVRWANSGAGVLFMPVRFQRQRVQDTCKHLNFSEKKKHRR